MLNKQEIIYSLKEIKTLTQALFREKITKKKHKFCNLIEDRVDGIIEQIQSFHY